MLDEKMTNNTPPWKEKGSETGLEHAMAYVLQMIARANYLPIPFLDVARGLRLLDEYDVEAAPTPSPTLQSDCCQSTRTPRESLENGDVERGGALSTVQDDAERRAIRRWAKRCRHKFLRVKARESWLQLLRKSRVMCSPKREHVLAQLRSVEDPCRVCRNLGLVAKALIRNIEASRQGTPVSGSGGGACIISDKEYDSNGGDKEGYPVHHSRGTQDFGEQASQLVPRTIFADEETCDSTSSGTFQDTPQMNTRSYRKTRRPVVHTVSLSAIRGDTSPVANRDVSMNRKLCVWTPTTEKAVEPGIPPPSSASASSMDKVPEEYHGCNLSDSALAELDLLNCRESKREKEGEQDDEQPPALTSGLMLVGRFVEVQKVLKSLSEVVERAVQRGYVDENTDSELSPNVTTTELLDKAKSCWQQSFPPPSPTDIPVGTSMSMFMNAVKWMTSQDGCDKEKEEYIFSAASAIMKQAQEVSRHRHNWAWPLWPLSEDDHLHLSADAIRKIENMVIFERRWDEDEPGREDESYGWTDSIYIPWGENFFSFCVFRFSNKVDTIQLI